MTDPETTAEAQLREIADVLEALRFRLLGVQASLPPSSLERDLLQEQDEMDTATEIRAVVGCVLEDRIEPALQELRSVGAEKTETGRDASTLPISETPAPIRNAR